MNTGVVRLTLPDKTEDRRAFLQVNNQVLKITASHHCGGETFQSIFSLFD